MRQERVAHDIISLVVDWEGYDPSEEIKEEMRKGVSEPTGLYFVEVDASTPTVMIYHMLNCSVGRPLAVEVYIEGRAPKVRLWKNADLENDQKSILLIINSTGNLDVAPGIIAYGEVQKLEEYFNWGCQLRMPLAIVQFTDQAENGMSWNIERD